MGWDRDDWLAAALICIIVVAGAIVGFYALGIMEKTETIESQKIESHPEPNPEPMPENQTQAEAMEANR